MLKFQKEAKEYSVILENQAKNSQLKTENSQTENTEEILNLENTEESQKQNGKLQKKIAKMNKEPVSDFKIMLPALLGASAGIYTFMFIFKYKLKNIIFMVLLPIFTALTVYAVYFLFSVNFKIVF